MELGHEYLRIHTYSKRTATLGVHDLNKEQGHSGLYRNTVLAPRNLFFFGRTNTVPTLCWHHHYLRFFIFEIFESIA